MGRFIAGVLAMVLSGCAAEGAERKKEGSSGELRLDTERVVIFKDGHALLLKHAEAIADARGQVFTEQVPDSAVLGTFWAWSESGPAVRVMRAEWVEREVEREERGACSDPAAILTANPGKLVTVELENLSLTGTVLVTPAVAPGAPPAPRARSAYDPHAEAAFAPQEPLVALAVPERGTVVLAGRDIRRVSGPELTLECRRKVRTTEKRKRLSLDFGADAAGKALSVRLVYFTPGLRWIPTYRLDVREGGTGALALQAELLNELEDIRGAAVDLVVGVPNFRFRDVVSPLSLEGVVRSTLAQAAPSLMGSQNAMSNALFTQRMGEWRGDEGDTASPNIPDFGGPDESADFFIHPLASLDLPKGSRAVVPLWREEVPTRDLYTLDMKVHRGTHNSDTVRFGGPGASTGSSSSPLRLAQGQVWHQLELKNGTKYPLTTGAVLVMRGQVPQAQELLTFTPRGTGTLVPLTIATGVRSFHEETELSNKPNALELNKVKYALIRKKGTLTLSNPRGERMPLRIRLSTGGKVEQVSNGGRVKVDDFHTGDWSDSQLARVNNHSDVEWAVTLEPGERRDLTYEVSFYR